ncbi:unnamed protein product [Rotaria sp. Silwood1]|nr:unnamed protein product [Rotaria sp. Silwood1]CAF1222217.1 unnamed protein product [Rotaria sp. Silwood1]CAF3470301.1 unnamed protein product [Rotaria sp. Silwood1]CAF3492275.1 unnamed protein product [Rotaria sp. Silwood1]CAF4554701.1 unnamed protein product [Rotaria sp. Silwood1]
MATKTTSDRFLDANEELVAKSIPIKSYEKQALVPIEEATKTLKRLVNNLDKMVQMAKKNFDQLTNLTQDEAVAIHLYTIKSKKSDTSLSIQLNRALRSGVSKQTDPWSSYIKLFLSALCKLTPFEGKIYRGCQEKPWLDCQYHVGDKQSIMTPENLQTIMNDPPVDVDDAILDRVQGSMVGMALGDALGAHVEFRPRQYLIEHPVRDLVAGGTWGLKKGQVI